MNQVFRSVWNATVGTFVAAPEIAGRSSGEHRIRTASDGRRTWRMSPLALACALGWSSLAFAGTPPAAQQLPSGGQVVAGQASLQQSGATLNINQTSARAILNWQSFDVGSAATVNFKQPDASSVTLNRVLGSDPSQIFGRINANGQVFLSNPNGVYFSPTASVNVGGLLATSARIGDADFMAGKLRFTNVAGDGSVINEGTLTAELGGYIALLAPEVRNQGVIVAQLGSVALAAGQAYELQVVGRGLAGITVTPGQMAALVENRSAVQAPGGLVILSAQALNQLQGSVVNSGSVEASSLSDRGGRIVLDGGSVELSAGSSIEANGGAGGGSVAIGSSGSQRLTMASSASVSADATQDGSGGNILLLTDLKSGSTTAQGRLSARGAGAGNGGQIETSGSVVNFNGLSADTSAARGATGNWLVDPYDLNVDATAATTISSNLASSNITLQTTATGTSGTGTANASGAGDININAAIGWSSANTLTLDAYRNVHVAAPVTVSGAGKVKVVTGDTAGNGVSTGGELEFGLTAGGFGGSLNFTGATSGAQSLTINAKAYKLLYSLTDLQTVNAATTGQFALARSLNLASSGMFNAAPVRTINGATLDGLGNTISNMSLSTTNQFAGFFSALGDNSVVRNLGVVNSTVAASSPNTRAGLLVGQLNGSQLQNVYATGSVTASGQTSGSIGVLAGMVVSESSTELAAVRNAFSMGSVQVSGTGAAMGGLVGDVVVADNGGVTSLNNVFSTASVASLTTGTSYVGGLVGEQIRGSGVTTGTQSITNAMAYGPVSGASGKDYISALVASNGSASGTGKSSISGALGTGVLLMAAGTNRSGGAIGSAAASNSVVSSAYFDLDTTGVASAVADGSTAQMTSQLQTGTLPAGFSSAYWAASAGSYPYLKYFFPNGVQSISGKVYQANGSAAVGAKVSLYTGGASIAMDQVYSGANGYYYAVAPAGTLPAGAASHLGGTLSIGAAAPSGASYSDSPRQDAGADIIGFDLRSGVSLMTTHLGSVSALNTDLTSTYGAALGTISSSNITGLWQLNAAGSFTVDAPVTQTAPVGIDVAGDLAINAALKSSGLVSLRSTGTMTEGAGGSVNATGLALLGGKVALTNSANAVPIVVGSGLESAAVTTGGSMTVGSLGSVQQGVNDTNILGTSGSLSGLGVSGQIRLLAAGDVSINAALSSSGGSATLQGGGNVTDGVGGSIQTLGLLLTGGDVTIDNTGNSFGTVAASGVRKLAVLSSEALTIGTVGGTAGVNASGTINIATGSGDLTVAQSVATSDSTAAAITLNAGQTAAAGTAAGGNIVVSNGASFGTGSGGRATLYSGSATADSSLAALIGTGSGRFRYNSDEAASNYSTALGSGLYGIYRQSISTSIVYAPASRTYGDAATAYGYSSGLVNGDAVQTVVNGVATSSSGNLKVGSYGLSASNLAALTGLGYVSAGNSNGTLTITPRALSVSGITAGNKVYDGTTAASVDASGAIVAGSMAGDQLTVTATGAFANKDAANNATVQVNGSLGGVDAGNYTITGPITTTANITPKILGIQGLSAADKIYDGTSSVSITDWGHVTTGVGSETLTLQHGAASFSDANAGNGKTVTAGGYSLANGANGGTASNYVLSSSSATTTASIGKAGLTVIANDDAKLVTQKDDPAYNGVSYKGFVGGDTASNSVSGTLALVRSGMSANQGQGDPVGSYAGTLNASGLSASNYAISYQPGTYTIVPTNQLLIKSGSTFDGYGSAPSFINVTAQYIDDGKVIHSLTRTGGAGNTYVFSDDAGGTATVTLAAQAPVLSSGGYLTVGNYAVADANPQKTGSNFNSFFFVGNLTVQRRAVQANASPVSKVYDGTNGVTNLSLSLAGVLDGDHLGVSGTGQYSQKNVGTNLGYSVSNVQLSSDDAANYFLLGGTHLSGNNGSITPKTLTVSGITAADKVYDRSTSAATDTSHVVLDGLVAGDSVSVGSTGLFSDKNVGVGKTVALTNVYGGGDLGNYTLVDQASTTASITPRTLTVSGLQAAGRIYDGTTGAVVNTTNETIGGLLAGDDVAVQSTGSFADKNVGVGKAVQIISSISGDDAGNYTLSAALFVTTADITPKSLTISGVTARDKVYDGTTGAALDTSHLSYVGLAAGDDFSTAVAGSFADKNVGTNKSIGLSYTDSGADVGNYTIDRQASTSASITPKTLTVSGLSAQDKVYDRTTVATIDASRVAFDGLVNGDSVTLASTGAFGDKNVGGGKTVTLTNVYGGGDLGNYTLVDQLTTTATITPKTVTVSGLQASGRVYDGTTAAAVDTRNETITGLLAGDDIAVQSTGSFADKNVGVGKAVQIVSSLTGDDAGNYALSAAPFATTADITPKALTISGVTARDKVYDGTTGAVLDASHLSYVGLAAGDDFSTAVTGRYVDKNVGTNKAVGLSYTDSGADAGNYAVDRQASTSASITPKTLTISGITAQDKVYDGNANAIVNVRQAHLDGLVAQDQVTVAASGSFSDKNVGDGKTVSLSNSLGGADLRNYDVSVQATTTASISPKVLVVNGVVAQDKVYDGTRDATVDQWGTVDTGIAGEQLNLQHGTASFADPNAGAGKLVTVGGYSLTDGAGGQASNYQLVSSQVTTTATIGKRTLTVDDLPGTGGSSGSNGSGNSSTPIKTYDGSTQVNLDTRDVQIGNVVNGDQIGVHASGTADDPNAGVDKGMTISVGLTGQAANNYQLPTDLPTRGLVTVRQADLTVTARDLVQIVNGAAFSGGNGVQYAGFVAGEDAGVLSGSLAYGGTAQGAAMPGSYSIAASGLSARNYAIRYVDGTLSLLTAPDAPVGGTSNPGGSVGSERGGGDGTPSNSGGNDGHLTDDWTRDGDQSSSDTGSTRGRVPGNAPGNAVNAGDAENGIHQAAVDERLVNNGSDGRLADAWSRSREQLESVVSGAWAGDDVVHEGQACFGGHITVDLFLAPTQRNEGKATVCVPQEVSRRAAGFSFPLPPALVRSIESDRDVTVTLASGEALPQWLRYDAARRMFLMNPSHAGALPLQIVVNIRGQRTEFTITEKSRPLTRR